MWIPLGDVARVSTGYPFRKKVESEEGGDIVLVQIKDVDITEGISGIGTVLLRSEGGTYDKYLLQTGDLLFQSRGARHPVAVVQSGVRGIAATGLHVIRPDRRRVMPNYLAWWLNHPRSQERLKDVARGTYIPFVAKTDLQAFLLPMPSLGTQSLIVDVDHLRRREDALRIRLEKLTQKLIDAATWAAATRKSED